MDCKELRELLDLYSDGELSPDGMAAASVHLSECVSCRRVSEELLRLRQGIKEAVGQHQIPHELVKSVHGIYQTPWRRLFFKSNDKQSSEPFWKRRVALPAPAFALLLFAIIALGMWIVSTRRAAPAQADMKPKRVLTAPALNENGGMDFTRFDRGERAAIYKVERTSQGDRQQ